MGVYFHFFLQEKNVKINRLPQKKPEPHIHTCHHISCKKKKELCLAHSRPLLHYSIIAGTSIILIISSHDLMLNVTSLYEY